MATASSYVVNSVTSDYYQEMEKNVPCWRGGAEPIFFGPCKKEMRWKVQKGDWVFGISGGKTSPRRIVFIMPVADRMTFAQAYDRFPDLRAWAIHVKPLPNGGYEHIPGAIHEDGGKWWDDVNPKHRDVFLVGDQPSEDDEKHRHVGLWLGPRGPAMKGKALAALQKMSVWKGGHKYRSTNDQATEAAPIRHGNLYTGLHCEGDGHILEELLQACLEHLPGGGQTPSCSWGNHSRSVSPSRRCCR